jgi:hypothetical protein
MAYRCAVGTPLGHRRLKAAQEAAWRHGDAGVAPATHDRRSRSRPGQRRERVSPSDLAPPDGCRLIWPAFLRETTLPGRAQRRRR